MVRMIREDTRCFGTSSKPFGFTYRRLLAEGVGIQVLEGGKSQERAVSRSGGDGSPFIKVSTPPPPPKQGFTNGYRLSFGMIYIPSDRRKISSPVLCTIEGKGR
ncbi:hypothetical protein M413DRAFT_189308 [Hebeloma cylindrosporum]|uniref:Uncharacterized protein n=1 Tax=Hebeloma cylindrosporum TaxID=76867 RepID=A0A0C2XQU7_HEBCY|nr:hypothetical protein M413DRAFT_189308 [Hebeloma cylindrosporum h7]